MRIPLNALRAIEVVGRTGSLGRAAQELNVSVGAVGQHIRKAEERLGLALFDRTPAGLVPTKDGQRMLARLRPGFRALDEAVESVVRTCQPVLTITAAPAFASRWLVPRLSRFSAAHPNIEIRVDATTKVVDLTRSPADVAVRMGRGGWPDVHAEKLAPHDVFPVCSPAFRDRLRRPADLARVPVIHDEGTIFPWADWFRSAGIARVPRLAGPTFSDPVLALEAALAGQGVVLAWEMIVADAIADGRLIRPFPTISKTPVSYWLLATPAKLRLRTVRAFRSWLVEEVDRTLRPRT